MSKDIDFMKKIVKENEELKKDKKDLQGKVSDLKNEVFQYKTLYEQTN